jgi:hypothetical protein
MGFGSEGTHVDDDQAPILDVELIVADLNGPGAVGVTTKEGQRFLVVDKTFPKNDPRARARAFRAYLMQAIPKAMA